MKSQNLSWSWKHGSEGPAHDPYSYTELTVTRPGQPDVVLHEGLREFIRVGDTTMDQSKISNRTMRDIFVAQVGWTPEQLERFERRKHERCRNCGCRSSHGADGYPGESFEICDQCGAVVCYHFNEGAVI